ncbi:hypothetical protein RQP46_004761 [Phenoliferia psychrophenolica]
MNAAVLPAPLHLRLASYKTLSPAEAQLALSSFLAVDAQTVLANSGGAAVARSNLARLAEALKEELVEQKPSASRKASKTGGASAGGKKRKSEAPKDGEGKRRKVAQA